MKIGFCGQQGSHSEVALLSLLDSQPAFKVSSASTHPFHVDSQREVTSSLSLSKLFSDLLNKKLDFLLLPIENTLSGTFTQHYDLLLQYIQKVFIVAEWIIQEENVAMRLDTAQDVPIEAIYSHQHIIQQASSFIKELQEKNSNLKVYAMEDPSQAAQWVKESNQKNAAVLAHPRVAQVHGFRVIKEHLNERVSSQTRYLLLSASALTEDQLSLASQRSKLKTSVMVYLNNQPGMLFKSLGCLSFRDLNISKLESRPSPRAWSSFSSGPSVWEYVNYLDFEGGLQEENVKAALKNLEEFASQLKVFGSYPRFNQKTEGASVIGG